jgi:hypothetical protein
MIGLRRALLADNGRRMEGGEQMERIEGLE